MTKLVLAAFPASIQKPAKPKRGKTGEAAVSQDRIGTGNHGESAEYDPPTPHERMKNHAQEEKIDATRRWVAGRITTKEHNDVHRRANHVIKHGVTEGKLPKGVSAAQLKKKHTALY